MFYNLSVYKHLILPFIPLIPYYTEWTVCCLTCSQLCFTHGYTIMWEVLLFCGAQNVGKLGTVYYITVSSFLKMVYDMLSHFLFKLLTLLFTFLSYNNTCHRYIHFLIVTY